MSKRTPSPSSAFFEMQLMQQRMQQQNQLASEQEAFRQSQAQQQQAAAARVNNQQTQMDASIKKQIAKPVKLGTLLTNPNGLLGNPLLSGTKLSG